jgi:hypothetical protein
MGTNGQLELITPKRGLYKAKLNTKAKTRILSPKDYRQFIIDKNPTISFFKNFYSYTYRINDRCNQCCTIYPIFGDKCGKSEAVDEKITFSQTSLRVGNKNALEGR